MGSVAASVSLAELIDTMEVQLEESSLYVDPETGEILAISNEMLRCARADETPRNLSDWEAPDFAAARRLVEGGKFLELPDQWDINEWEIMHAFSAQETSGAVRDDLLNAISGRGAFRMFKDTIRRHRIESKWYDYRALAFREIAIEWCEENGLAWH